MQTKKLVLKKDLKTLREMIARKCVDCCAGNLTEVVHCGITDCPLYKERPVSKKGLRSLK